MKANLVKPPGTTTLASPLAATCVATMFAGYLVASHLLPGPRTIQQVPYGLSCFLLGSFVVNGLVIQRVQQRRLLRSGECSAASWLALVPLAQLGLLLACHWLPDPASALMFDTKYAPAFIGGLLAAPYAVLALRGVKARLQSAFPGRVAGAAVVPVGVALVAGAALLGAALCGIVAGLAYLAKRRPPASSDPLAGRLVIGLLLAACVGLVHQQPQPIWAGNVASLSGSEFQRQMARYGLAAAADDHGTIFRAVAITPEPRSAAANGRGLSDSQLLGYLAQIDTSLEALLAGPHADLITHEGTLKFMEPTLHSVSVFQNEVIDVWILLEKKYSEGKWRRYALIQDKTIEPNVAHYFQWAFDGSGTLVRRGATCYQCHTSGPRAMREVRADLLVGKRYAEQMNRYVRQLDFVETRFSEAEPRADFGPALAIDACTQCHGRDAQRGPLYPLHRLTIETLLDRGAMPPDSCPSAAERAAIRTWLDGWFNGQTQSDGGEVVANPKDA